MKTNISQHAYQRANQHRHLSRKKTKKLVKSALKTGTPVRAQQSRRGQEWLNHRIVTNSRVITADGVCLILSAEGTIVTMYPLPGSYRRKPLHAGKERIRKIRKYARFHPEALAREAPADFRLLNFREIRSGFLMR